MNIINLLIRIFLNIIYYLQWLLIILKTLAYTLAFLVDKFELNL